MTSAHAKALAHYVIENDPQKAGPLVKLLFAFRSSRGDPLGEAMMSDVIRSLYATTEHCENVIATYAVEPEEIPESVAA